MLELSFPKLYKNTSNTYIQLLLHNQLPLVVKGDSKRSEQFFHMLETGKKLTIKQGDKIISHELFQEVTCCLTSTLCISTKRRLKDILDQVQLSEHIRMYFDAFDQTQPISKLSQDDQMILQVATVLNKPFQVLLIQGDWTGYDKQALEYIKEIIENRCNQGCYIIISETSTCLFDEYEIWEIDEPQTTSSGFLEETILLSSSMKQTKKIYLIPCYLSKLFFAIYLIISMLLVIFVTSFPCFLDPEKKMISSGIQHYEASGQYSLYLSANDGSVSKENMFVPEYPYSYELIEKLKITCKDAFLAPIHRGHFQAGNNTDVIAIIKDGKRIALQSTEYGMEDDISYYNGFMTFHAENADSLLAIDDVQEGVYLSRAMIDNMNEDLMDASIELKLNVPVRWIKSPTYGTPSLENQNYRLYYQPVRVTLPIAGVIDQTSAFYGELYIPDSIYQSIYQDALARYDEMGPANMIYDGSDYERSFVEEGDTIMPYTPAMYVMTVSDQAEYDAIKQKILDDDTMNISFLDQQAYLKEMLYHNDITKDAAMERVMPLAYIGGALSFVTLLLAVILHQVSRKNMLFQTKGRRIKTMIGYVILEVSGAMLILVILSSSWFGDTLNAYVNHLLQHPNNSLYKYIAQLSFINTWIQSDLWQIKVIFYMLLGCILMALLPFVLLYLIQKLKDYLIRKGILHVSLSKM